MFSRHGWSKFGRRAHLDDVCTFAGGDPQLPIKALGTLGDSRLKLQPAIMLPLSWLYCFPSARQAWASFYHGATRGHLDVCLPKASVTFDIRGLRDRHTCYVSSLKAIQVEAREEPFAFAKGHPRVIVASAHQKRGLALTSASVAQHPAQQPFVRLSDEEWAAIEPLLASSRGMGASDSRGIVDAILWKYAEGLQWRDVVEARGRFVARAPTSLSRWKADGRWDAVARRLDELRVLRQ
jgi:hypothetical protein